MSKRGRHKKGGRVTPKGTRPRHSSPPTRESSSEPDLLDDVRRALREHPLAVLEMVSAMITTLDRRVRSPLDRSESGVTTAELVDSFLGVPLPETSALLAAFAVLLDDELLRMRIRRELAVRDDPLPVWLARLAEAEVYGITEMVHVLGDGDNVFLGVRLADGQELSVVVYIDHNLGSLVKDAFAVPESMGRLVDLYRSKVADRDTTFDPLDPADARVRITDAVDRGAVTFPPFTSDTWPACRPLVEWLVRRLPEGGRPYPRPEWSERQLTELTERFLASPLAEHVDADQVSLLEDVLWFGTDYGPGDPLRWSAVAVEILLVDWIPRKIVAEADHLAKAPDLLRAFVTWCHQERGIRPELTAETLDAVDRWAPTYQEAIRTPRHQGAMAILDAMGALADDEDDWWVITRREELVQAVGSQEALDALDDRPLPDEPFAWTGIPEDAAAEVGAVLDLVDRCADELFDVEFRTAFRRFLHRAAVGDPSFFRRGAKAEGLAAAVCWAVGTANEAFGPRRYVKDLVAWFGVRGPADRGRRLVAAAGGPETMHAVRLGSPELLVSGHRRTLLRMRGLVRSAGNGG